MTDNNSLNMPARNIHKYQTEQNYTTYLRENINIPVVIYVCKCL